MLVIGDVHGKIEQLKKLLEIIPQDREICFVGDLIDRGDYSLEVVELVRKLNAKCVMGNHEKMCIDTKFGAGFFGLELWLLNGGDQTLRSYESKDKKETLEWMKKLPLTVRYTNKAGQKFIVSHSFVFNVINFDEQSKIFEETVLWSRIDHETKLDHEEYINVIGHTPVEEIVKMKDVVFVDTGCYHTGVLSAYDLETGLNYSTKL